MAFERPTLTQLVERIQADFVSRLDLVGALLRRAVVYVLTRVVAGAVHMLHGHLEFLGRQLFPDQSEDEFLVRQASLFGLTKTAPSFGKYSAQITGTNGAVCPASTLLVSSAGFEFSVDADATIAGGVATIGLTAVLAGTDPNLVVAAVLSFESPVANINSTAEVTAVTSDGTDEETTEELRTRLLERMAEAPHGGNDADYIAWAKAVAGVTRVWVTRLGLGPGTVLVRFARDDDASPIPDAGEVAAVQTYIDAVKPAHATVTVAAPIDAPQAMTIHIVPDTVALRDAVTAQLSDFIKRVGSPGATLLVSGLRTAIGTTAGITDYTLTVPAADVVLTTGQLARLGTITWT